MKIGVGIYTVVPLGYTLILRLNIPSCFLWCLKITHEIVAIILSYFCNNIVKQKSEISLAKE